MSVLYVGDTKINLDVDTASSLAEREIIQSLHPVDDNISFNAEGPSWGDSEAGPDKAWIDVRREGGKVEAISHPAEEVYYMTGKKK